MSPPSVQSSSIATSVCAHCIDSIEDDVLEGIDNSLLGHCRRYAQCAMPDSHKAIQQKLTLSLIEIQSQRSVTVPQEHIPAFVNGVVQHLIPDSSQITDRDVLEEDAVVASG